MNDTTIFTHNPDALAPEAAALLPRLADADPVVRRIALLELADLEDADALQPIVDMLKNDNAADVRGEAARVLGAWEQPWIVDALCHALLDVDAEVREAAALGLSTLKDVRSGAVLCTWADHAEPFVQAAVLHGLRELRFAGAFEPALRALTHDDAGVRIEAVGVLGWLKDARALPPLAVLATGDANAEIRRTAVGALGFATSIDATVSDALLRALKDPVWQVREEAATTLGKMRATSARDALIAALDDDYWQVRLRTARALGQIGDRIAALPLTALLKHSISNLRKEAALALGELREPSCEIALRAALDDADPDVRKAVRIALQQIEEASR